MQPVSIDFETRSIVDLRRTGVVPYAQHPSTLLWLMAVAFGDEDPILIYPPTNEWGVPEAAQRLVDHINAGGELHAWNAMFERTLWKYSLTWRMGWPEPKLEQWHCTMARAAACGLPQSLDQAAKVLKMKEQKDTEGHNLMMRMSRPRSYNSDGSPVWWDVPERLDRLGKYCQQDVRTERAIKNLLPALPPNERKIWLLDQTINDRGILLDKPLATAARDCAEKAATEANNRLEALTEGAVQSVTAVADITAWINKQGVSCDSIAKAAVSALLQTELTKNVEEVLSIRAEAGKSSNAKIDSMLEYSSAGDGRMHGLLAYHGAATGRWAGRGPQPQNFPRGTVAFAEAQIPLVLEGNVEAMDLIAPPLETISSMLRNMIVAAPGHRLVVADYASIEARVLAWVAGETRMLEAFRTGKDPYKLMASDIYEVPMSQVSKEQRAVGKAAVLGLGYQMGADKFQAQQALAGVALDWAFGKKVVDTYRQKNRMISALWNKLDSCAVDAVRTPGCTAFVNGITFQRIGDWLYMILPSGRKLTYHDVRIVPRETPWGEVRDSVQCSGFNSVTRQWQRQYLYGGLLTENAVQAIARDLMAEAMLRIDAMGYPVVLTVHDEVVSEAPEGFGSVKEFEEHMVELPEWARGLPVAAEAWEGARYRK